MRVPRKRKCLVTVFITGRRETYTMAQAILHDHGIDFAGREAMAGEAAGEGCYEIGVATDQVLEARRLLKSLVEFDAGLCGR